MLSNHLPDADFQHCQSAADGRTVMAVKKELLNVRPHFRMEFQGVENACPHVRHSRERAIASKQVLHLRALLDCALRQVPLDRISALMEELRQPIGLPRVGLC